MPTLQGLPQEILEMIFLQSMNISLPRASPDLGRKLSHKVICMKIVMRTFFEESDDPLASSQAQADLLRCKFFTWSFFLDYVNTAHSAVLKKRHKAWASTGIVVPGVSYFTPLWPFKFTQLRYLGFAEPLLIPEKLLHGPWTNDKASLLYVLVAFSGEIDCQGSLDGETASEGLREAIKQGNELAVAALSVLLGIGRMLTTDLIRFAVMQCGCNINIVRHLLYNAQILHSLDAENKESLDFHDPALWRWIEQAEEEDDPKGSVVKMMLKEADRFALNFYLEGESDWADIVPFPYSGAKFDTRGSFDNLKKELLTRVYQSNGRRIVSPRRVRLPEGDL